MKEDVDSSLILIVDDNVHNIKVLGKMLEEHGYDVAVCMNGVDTLEFVNQEHPDLILLDIMMPEMDGYEACQILKANPETAHIPIIFLTARTESEDIVKGFTVGGVDYITKPFYSVELIARIKTHLHLRSEIQEREKRESALVHELEQARRAQKALLPAQFPSIPQVRTAVRYQPMQEIGGDLFNIFDLEDKHFGIMIADMTGHGIPAALLSFMVWGIFMNTVKRDVSPQLALRLTNERIYHHLPEAMLASMLYGIYDAAEQTLTFSSAGHPAGIVLRPKSQEVIVLHSEGTLIGVFPGKNSLLGQQTVQLSQGDKLLFYTDAITEVADGEGTMLGMELLLEFLRKHLDTPLDALLDAIYDYGLQYASRENYTDDFTLVGLELI